MLFLFLSENKIIIKEKKKVIPLTLLRGGKKEKKTNEKLKRRVEVLVFIFIQVV